MKTIVDASKIVNMFLGLQTVKSETDYKRIKYILSFKCEDGYLVYNVFTNEVILLDNVEYDLFFNKLDKLTDLPIYEELIKKWFLIPIDKDDFMLAEQAYNILRLTQLSQPKPAITSYTILPTTDCNARCFYCFEHGTMKKTMTPKTAYALADYIKKNSKGEPVKLVWFGGEPLYNMEVIDIVCSRLRELGVEYVSKMISNAYLFDEDTVDKAWNEWKLNWVQITLDGTEQVYNRIKAYIYKNENAFERVLNNIELCLKAGIVVQVRLNMDQHNEEDLYELANQLKERFGGYKNFYVYAHLLFEDTCKSIASRSDVDRQKMQEKFFKLENYLKEQKLYFTGYIDKRKRLHLCQADGDECTIVMPDGNLGKCEHYTDSHFWGNIFTDEIEQKYIDMFKVRRVPFEHCKECPALPNCRPLAKCPGTLTRCDKYDQMLLIRHTEDCVRESYKAYLKKQNIN